MKKKEYRLILFDADNTLFDYKKGEEKALSDTLNEFNIKENSSEYLESYSRINSNIWVELENRTITKDDLKIERFKRLFRDKPLNFKIEDFALKYINNLSGKAFLIEGAVEICESLSAKYMLVIITNGLKDVQFPRIKNSGINKYIKNIAVSEEAGFDKPHQGIFEYAFKISNHKDKNDSLIIGDSLSSDITGGHNFGIDTCWFNPYDQKLTVDFKPTYIIKKLEELKEIL